ncbi:MULTISPECIES: GNAT family N-acetyltransferase [unclassified Streptomyces]|uniref:GNAT family N-acetyltransferase n=1 Tax=unclassified Streptomyces TaxID=2593676 RepID=UPI0022557355|nr:MULTISPECIES: GNAT family N-acetyltransferase [unclassified Streptomyces]MCX5147297.1 GNAT family N-acetyltransferase [Streptomyces sp. NBC_00320]WSN50430.1 GNAT family N-acetyltransferase [Streptomyces sp. NBC_01296]
MSHGIQLRAVPYDHPDAVKLNDQVQCEYQVLYGGEGDVTPLDPAMFAPPNGLYLLAYDASDTPVASGGWRSQDENDEGYADGDAELKRMYVVREARGLGLARRILAELESDARAAGRTRMALETGDRQPEAIALYLSSGYTLSAKFGHYRHYDSSRCMTKPLHP